ncbi:hypothetical protein C8F04DRAFT_1086864 [Mycena alexandri]|uniref:Chromo domain-containing protein n=1 Tax=Mycena alexandri TaxID=1745969 RepID=A0AAD6T409_9AGAR|nr:hypothetical protein C8F04DRAFT_1086864 [Mycena alexandri]
MPQEQFFVEVILKARRRKTGTQKIGTFPVSKFDIRSNAWEYLVHWAGWPDSDDSYEPVKNLADCTRLLQRFWEAAGKDGFLTNVVDFEIDAPEDWIRQEKAYFWSRHTPNEVRAQNDDPRQKHSTSKHGSSKPSTPSTSKTRGAVKTSPRTPSSPPKKVVSFALVADVIGIPKLTDVENTAQRYFTGTKQTYDSEDDEQMDVESHEETPTKMIKLRLLGPRPPTQAPPLDLQHNDEFDAAPTPEPTVSAHESTAEAPPATSNSGPPSPPPSPPTRRSGGIKFVENLGMTNPVMSTKSRLTKKPMAQGIPRASPVPAPPPKDAPTSASAPEGDAMDVDPTPMLFPDNIVDDRVGDADGLGPMLASMEPFNEDVGVGGSGFYDASEDRYAGLPKNGDPYGDSAYLNAGFDVDMPDTAASEFYVDQFLTTVP